MDPSTTSLHSSNSPHTDPQPAFAPTWNSPVAAHLAPKNLPLSKIQRAWDRRPQSPFSRKKVRFGKVWKRTAVPSNDATGMFGSSHGLVAIGGESPMKAVKKMRVESGEIVRDWDGRGSPERRIVTRSNRAEELVALNEEEPQDQDAHVEEGEEEEVLRTEVIGEDGTAQEIDAEEELQQDDWEDESATEEDVWDATLMHLGEVTEIPVATEDFDANAGEGKEAEAESETIQTDSAATGPATPNDGAQDTEPLVHSSDAVPAPPAAEPDTAGLILVKPSTQAPLLPDGFVSPIKERRRRPISQVRQAHANRRRTLPVDFSAAEPTLSIEVSKSQNASSHSEGHQKAEEPSPVKRFDQSPTPALVVEELEPRSNAEVTINEIDTAEGELQNAVPTTENEWEDVEEEDEPTDRDMVREVTPEQVGWVDTVENTPTSERSAIEQCLAAQVHERVAVLMSPSKLPSSPVPSIAGQHPRLPLRRSPRRQSASPLKRSAVVPSEKSHLIAFTPIKLPVYQANTPESRLASSPLPTSPALLPDLASPQASMPVLTRSSSAPPEEPQMSPRKPGQPRLSDDTALLQAFINRASENKNGRRTSATARRESLENRRNSDTVRHALASPAMKTVVTDVLGDLDPNSPSPRKQTAVDVKPPQQEDQDELAQSSPARTVSRRSGRRKKRPDTLSPTTYSRPNKIPIRGSADSVVLKKSEAQELSQRTRNNTKKNKGSAILPRLRLTRMAKEAALDTADEVREVSTEAEAADKKGIKWAETLATFHEGANEPEISMMIEELDVPEAVDEESSIVVAQMSGVPTPTPASETPSKPRQRRLKPGTASARVEVQAEQPNETKAKPVAKKRSRIATPAKSRGTTSANTSILPADEAKPEPKTTPAAKKAASKLPAPTLPAAPGKENSLIASPPKKRARAPAALPSDVAPTLKPKPKLDFTKMVGLEKKPADLSSSAVAGLASPAKRSARTTVLFGEDGSVTKKELPPSLGSPAKKRARRTPA